MKKNTEPSSFLLNEQDHQENSIVKRPNQFKALLFKNIRLQSKQKCTNACQIITPIICLIFTYLIKTVAQEGLKVNINFQDNKYPYKFNDFVDYDKLNNYTFVNQTTTFQTTARSSFTQYYLIECSQNCNKTFLGSNSGSERNQNKTGMLGQVPRSSPTTFQFFELPYDKIKQNNSTIKSSPFFVETENINKQLYKRLETIGSNSFAYIKDQTKHGLDYIPDGSIKFTQLNNESFNAQLKIDDCRDLQYHRINGISKNKEVKYYTTDNQKRNYSVGTDYTQAYGLLHVIHIATSSFIKTIKNATLSAGYLLMPPNQNSFVDTIINSISGLIYPLGLSLLFPVFLYSIVLQKQERLIQMMKMNGLKITNYWLTFFFFNLILCTITNLLFYLLGVLIVGSGFFTKTSKGLIFIVSIGWSLAQIGMAAFFQTFLSKSRSANIIGYLFSIWTTMIAATLNLGSYQYPSQFPISLQIIPPFAFVRIYYLMMIECSKGDCYYSIDLISNQVKQCIASLYVGFIVFFLLGVYLFEVIPQQFGVRRSPLFPIYSLLKLFKKKRFIQINTSVDPELKKYISEYQQDNYSKKQRQRVISFSLQQNQEAIKNQYPLIINNMRKLYKKQGIQGFYPAVRSLNLAISRRETFGLLGPNGAGKTTLISMITGMYEPNNGNAWIGGYDIQSNIEKAQLQMGVCPQFDLVWPQLSVEQHLYFYARLKGIPEKMIKAQVEASIKQVKLESFGKFAASELSGGMRRRLSVAISLVGNPKIVFLDQPSTGLDPQNRRQLWAVLAQCQTKRSLFITTHMMEEADTLCNRIGIITSGVLRTVESSIKLKKTYGEGYDVIINTIKQQRQLISRQSMHLSAQDDYFQSENQKIKQSIKSFIEYQISKTYKLDQTSRKIVQYMKKEFPGTYLWKHFKGYLIFKVPLTFKISALFETINKVKKQLGFSDVAITNSSLEDVFMKVVQKFDSNEKLQYPYSSSQLENNDGRQIQKQTQQRHFKKDEQVSPAINRSKKKFNSRDQQKDEEQSESFISKNRESVLSQHQPSERNSNKKQQKGKSGAKGSSNSSEYY